MTKKKKIELTEDQKLIAAREWDKKSMIEVTQEVFDDVTLETGCAEEIAVRAYVATLKVDSEPFPETVETSEPKISKGPIILTESQTNNIIALLNTDSPPPTREIVLTIFPYLKGKNLTPLHNEYKAVHAVIKKTNENAVSLWDEPVDDRRYSAPVKFSSLIGLVNRYVGNPNDLSRALYDPNIMKQAQTRNLQALYSYMKSRRFELQGSQYDKKADRELFESTFIRLVHDKGSELTPEDVETYISAAAQAVKISQLDRSIQKQQSLIDSTLEGEDDKDGTKAKLSMSLVESVNSLREKQDKAEKHYQSLLEAVQTSRSERNDAKSGRNECLSNLIQLWSEEKSRENLIELAKKEHAEDEKEMGTIRDYDELIARVMGMTFNEGRGGV